MVSLAKYPDLAWCLHNDLWRILVLFDDACDVHVLAQVIGIWRSGEFRKIAGKDHGSKILVVCVKIEEATVPVL